MSWLDNIRNFFGTQTTTLTSEMMDERVRSGDYSSPSESKSTSVISRFFKEPEIPSEAPDVTYAREKYVPSYTNHLKAQYAHEKSFQKKKPMTPKAEGELAGYVNQFNHAATPGEQKRIKIKIDELKAQFDPEYANKVFAGRAPELAEADFKWALEQSDLNMKKGVRSPEVDTITNNRLEWQSQQGNRK